MVYKPSKKELEQIVRLNEGYKLVKEGLKIIKNNIPKQDSEVEMQTYKISKNFDNIVSRIKRILERQYIDKEFLDIINGSDDKPKNHKKDSKKIVTKKKIIKKKKIVKERKPKDKK